MWTVMLILFSGCYMSSYYKIPRDININHPENLIPEAEKAFNKVHRGYGYTLVKCEFDTIYNEVRYYYYYKMENDTALYDDWSWLDKEKRRISFVRRMDGTEW